MKLAKNIVFALLVFVGLLAWMFSGGHSEKSTVQLAKDQLLAPTTQNLHDGIAVVILIDSSGSMGDSVPDASGKPTPKISIARRCVKKAFNQIIGFNKEQPLSIGYIQLTSFKTSTDGEMITRSFITMEDKGVDNFLNEIQPDGGTPIGDAIVYAANNLTREARCNRSHILIVTDGENTSGLKPDHVLAALNDFPEEARPHIYFIAFDVAAGVFDPLKSFGATILPASNESQLQASLDMLVGEKILLEK